MPVEVPSIDEFLCANATYALKNYADIGTQTYKCDLHISASPLSY